MEAKDIWLLLGGTFLGFIASLLATFSAPSIGSAFGKLKSGFIERNKARAFAAYVEARDLHIGKRDKYLYAINSWGFIIVQVMFFISGGFAGFMSRPTAMAPPDISSWLRVVALTVGLLALFIAGRRVAILFLTLERIANFDVYRAELLRRWPDLDLPE